MNDHTRRVLPWVHWSCDRCHREVIVEEVVVDIAKTGFVVRCPLCDLMVRFVTPPLAQLDSATGEPIGLTRSSLEVPEVH